MTWEPILTAPKSGEFLGYDSRTGKMDVCSFDSLIDGYGPVQFDGEYGPREDEFGYHSSDITHWMPLPEKPK